MAGRIGLVAKKGKYRFPADTTTIEARLKVNKGQAVQFKG
jgi:hypothetical protein